MLNTIRKLELYMYACLLSMFIKTHLIYSMECLISYRQSSMYSYCTVYTDCTSTYEYSIQ